LNGENLLVECWERNGGQGSDTALHVIQASEVSTVMYFRDCILETWEMDVLPIGAHMFTLDLAAAPSDQAGIASVGKGGTVHFKGMIQRGYSFDVR